MSDNSANATQLRECLVRFQRGDPAALNELISLASNRLQTLTRRMLRDYRGVHRWSETDDVLQNALIRFCRALKQVQPGSVREFYALAATQIRRELIDLARHYSGPQAAAAHHESWPATSDQEQPAGELSDVTHEPSALTDWREFHEQVASLPEEEREVFGLIFYQGMTQPNAAEVLGVNVRTIQRRWQTAMLTLHRLRGGSPPGT